jgi:uncharacterized membrane protein
MNTAARHPLVEDYLVRLQAEAARLPADQARELVADIDEHLQTALSQDASEAEVRNVLERLGTPDELVAEAGGAPTTTTVPHRSFASPTGAILCLVLAEVLSLLLPLSVPLWILGLVMMARATVFTEREKWLGFLGLGSGFPLAFVLIGASLVTVTSCSQVTENGQVVSDSCSGVDPVTVVAWVLTIGYVALQAFTIWRLTRSARLTRAAQQR